MGETARPAYSPIEVARMHRRGASNFGIRCGGVLAASLDYCAQNNKNNSLVAKRTEHGRLSWTADLFLSVLAIDSLPSFPFLSPALIGSFSKMR